MQQRLDLCNVVRDLCPFIRSLAEGDCRPGAPTDEIKHIARAYVAVELGLDAR